jgi:hypothetical protein
VIAAILYGTGAALQQHQASTAPDRAAGRLSLLLLLMRRPWWLLGIATEETGFAAHAVALRSGPLTIVQMLMASSLVFSVATIRLWSRRPLSWVAWAACGAVVAGIGAFVMLTSLSGLAGGQELPRGAGLAAACLGISAVPLAATGLAATGRRRAILLAVAAGLADAGMAVVTMAFARTVPLGPTAIVTSWPLYALIAAGFCSFLLTQTAYQAGFPMITLPIIAVVTPISSLATGASLLGETPHLGVARAAGLGFAVLTTAAGLVALARRTGAPHAPGIQLSSGPNTRTLVQLSITDGLAQRQGQCRDRGAPTHSARPRAVATVSPASVANRADPAGLHRAALAERGTVPRARRLSSRPHRWAGLV